MVEQLGDLQSLKQGELTVQEIDWLYQFMKLAFKKNVTEKDIVFTKNNDTHLTFYSISNKILNALNTQSVPERFLQSKFIILGVPDIDREEKYFVRIELIYWYFKHIIDIFDYKEILERIFSRALYGTDLSYNKRAKGYRVSIKHLKKGYGRWSVIRKTFLLGYASYLGLFKEATVLPLVRIYEGLKNKSLKQIGLLDATDEQFGQSGYYSRLGLCWHCGFTKVTNSGLCRDCSEYWDKRTK